MLFSKTTWVRSKSRPSLYRCIKNDCGMEHKVNVFALKVVVFYPLTPLPEIVLLSRSVSSAVVANSLLLLKSARQARVTKTSLVAGAS